MLGVVRRLALKDVVIPSQTRICLVRVIVLELVGTIAAVEIARPGYVQNLVVLGIALILDKGNVVLWAKLCRHCARLPFLRVLPLHFICEGNVPMKGGWHVSAVSVFFNIPWIGTRALGTAGSTTIALCAHVVHGRLFFGDGHCVLSRADDINVVSCYTCLGDVILKPCSSFLSRKGAFSCSAKAACLEYNPLKTLLEPEEANKDYKGVDEDGIGDACNQH